MTWPCIECTGHPNFPTLPALARHRNQVHPNRPLPKELILPATTNTDTQTICPDCGATFRGQHGLAVHARRTHGKTIKRPKAPKLDTIDAALQPLLKRRNRIDEQLSSWHDLNAERDRLDKAIAALEAAR